MVQNKRAESRNPVCGSQLASEVNSDRTESYRKTDDRIWLTGETTHVTLLDHATFLSVIAVSFSTLLGRVAGEVNELGGEGLSGDWSVVGGSKVNSTSAASNLEDRRFLNGF
jgi:hypothetical protein